jgi:VanZ family protein
MKLKYISWIPAALLMIIIFSFSSKPAVSSNETSLRFADGIINVFEKVTGTEYSSVKRTEMIETANHIVRKGGHFSEYALLACTLVLHLLALKKRGKVLIITPVILSALYASTDELHQLFVAGRSCQLSDVFLDTCGAATGTLIFLLLLKLYKKHKVKQKLETISQ